MRRLVFLLGIAAYVIVGLAWLARDRSDVVPRQPGSSLDTSPSGASLAFAYLQGRGGGGTVARLTAPLRLPEAPALAVVFRLRPGDVSRRGQTGLLDRHEEDWVRAGGRLVLALDSDYGGLSLSPPRGGPPRKVHPLWPEVRQLRPSPRRTLDGPALSDAVTLFASGNRTALLRIVRGAGDVVVLASPEVLENGLLARADHLRLLERLAGRGRPIFFDEGVHGLAVERGLLRLLLDWGLGPALALAALAGLLVLWRGRSRVGPPEDDWEDTRSEAVDLVGSLAQLYRRALRRDEAVALYRDALRRAIALRTGNSGAALEARVRRLTGGMAPPGRRQGRDLSDAELAVLLATINRGFGELRHARSR